MNKPAPFWSDEAILAGSICPYCHVVSELVEETAIYGKNYSGRQYFRCLLNKDHYVGCYRSKEVKSLGRLADVHLRALKMECHQLFDVSWKNAENQQKAREDAYQQLSEELEIPKEFCHIGMMDEAWCHYLILFLKVRH